MGLLQSMFQKIVTNTATKVDTEVFLDEVCSSYDSWKEERDNRTEEEEKAYFIKRMRNWGFTGNTYEEAMNFLDKVSPSNCRRENMKKRTFKAA